MMGRRKSKEAQGEKRTESEGLTPILESVAPWKEESEQAFEGSEGMSHSRGKCERQSEIARQDKNTRFC